MCLNVAFLLTTYLPLLVHLVSECPPEWYSEDEEKKERLFNGFVCDFSDAHVETWTDDLAGGILFQDDSYPVHAYNDRVQAQDRFLNLTYRTPNVIKTPERLLRANAAVALARGHPGGPQQIHHVCARFMFSRNPEFSTYL